MTRLFNCLQPARRRFAAVAVVVVVASMVLACGSAPVTHFHTLLPAPDSAGQRASASVPAVPWELLPVTIPAQLDQPQWVVRAADDTLAVLEQERWIAPLADEIRAAVSDRLTATLGLPGAPAKPGDHDAWRVRIEVQRLEAAPGRYARLEATWELRGADARALFTCRGAYQQRVEPGYAALAAGHRQAVVRLADAVGSALLATREGPGRKCPAEASP